MPGGFYHVTLRGNHSQPVFFRDADRDLMATVVAEAANALCARVHAYCWMTNHIHLLVQVSDRPLGKVVHRIASRYARTVQLRLKTTGHLFERRYHARLVDAERYLLAVVRYIHLNPVEAQMVAAPSEYAWSSHRLYLGLADSPWVTTSTVLELLTSDPGERRAAYQRLMEWDESSDCDPLELASHPKHPDILGDDAFIARVRNSTHQPPRKTPLEEIIRECNLRFDVSLDSMASRSRTPCLVAARAWLAFETVRHDAETISAIARLLNRTEGALRYLMRKYPRVEVSD